MFILLSVLSQQEVNGLLQIALIWPLIDEMVEGDLVVGSATVE